jgi:hypothetical protein
MNLKEEKRLAKWFYAHVKSFADRSGKLDPMLKLKLDHSERVAENAAGIAGDLGYSAGEIRAARTLGLFHDIARFTQFTRHRTFRDELSFNHGRHGAEIMKKCPALAACPDADKRRIIAGIRHHNRARLPERLDRGALEFVKLARDADKLDIFYVLYDTWKSGELRRYPEITLMVKLDGGINPKALAEIKRGRMVSVSNIKSLADFFLLQLSWVYDLNFRPSYRRLLRRSVIENIAETLPRTAEIRKQVSLARRHALKKLA